MLVLTPLAEELWTLQDMASWLACYLAIHRRHDINIVISLHSVDNSSQFLNVVN